MLTKVDGNTITHRWPLNIENVHEIEEQRWGAGPGDEMVVYDLGAPAAGYCWVVKSVTLSYDVQPALSAMFYIDSNTGASIWWTTFLGQAVIGIATDQGPWRFPFEPAIKFPVDEDVAFNYIGGDGATAYYFTAEVWQEELSIS